jgi:hypothetical protein
MPTPECPERLQDPYNLLFNGYYDSFLRVKESGYVVDLLPSNTEVKNECLYTSSRPLCLQIMGGNSCVFCFCFVTCFFVKKMCELGLLSE